MKNLAIILLLVSTNLYAQNLQLIDWFAGADLVGMGNSNKELASDFAIREFEIAAYSQIDYIWQGSLNLAIHKELGSSETAHAEIHEAYIFSNKLLDNTSVKIGRFFLGFGRLNRFHRHDWAFTEAPLYHSEFFGDEAVRDNGIQVSKLLADDFFLKLTAGLTTGNEFKEEHNHDEEEQEFNSAHVPTHYLRLSSFKEFTTQKGMEYAINYIGRTDGDGSRFNYTGVDFIFKNKFAKFYKDLLQFEAWQRTTSHQGEAHELNDFGAYIYYEKGFDQNHSIGFKLDWYKPQEHDETEVTHEHEFEVDGEFTELAVVYSYYNSEFMRTRLTLAHSNGLVIEEEKVSNTKVLFQTVFMVGAHPAHLY